MVKLMYKCTMVFILTLFVSYQVQADDYYSVNVGYQTGANGILGDFAYGGALAGSEGTTALNSLEIHLVDAPYASNIEYRVYTVSGWSSWYTAFQSASNNNEAILGLQIKLKDFPNANVYYQSYRKGLGWGSWVSNGKTSGTLSSTHPITGFRVQVDEIGINYTSSIKGESQVLRHNGETQGTGSLEILSMHLISAESGSIEYRAYLRNSGWTNWVKDGSTLGSKGAIIEALEAKLVGMPQYSVQIQPQVESEWWGYVYDGQTAGSIGSRLTAYRIKIVQKVNSTSIINASRSVNNSNSSSQSNTSICPDSLGSDEVVVWTNDSDLVASTSNINLNQIRTEGNKTFFSFLTGSTVSFSALIIDTNLSTLSFDTSDIVYACFGSDIAQTLGYETKELSFTSVTTYDSFDYNYYYNHYQEQWSWFLFDVVDSNGYEYYEYNAFYPPIG